MLKLFVLSAVLAVACANTNVQRCAGNLGPLPRTTRIEGCTNPPCQLPQLRDAVIHMTFNAPRNIQSMRTIARAYLGSVGINHNLGANANTCNFLTNARCPVINGQSLNYTLRMFIERNFPVGTQVTVQFRIVDQGNQPVVCLRVPIRITAPRLLTAEAPAEQVEVVDS